MLLSNPSEESSGVRSPLKLGFFGPMKTLESSKSGIEPRGKYGLRAWIDHAPMHGVTPEIMRWWFENIDCWTRFNGHDFTGPEVRAYRYWHPFDHRKVTWKKRVLDATGRTGPGSVIEIHEDIGGIYPVHASARVSQFDDGAFNFSLIVGGLVSLGELIHTWHPGPAGLEFHTEMIVDSPVPIVGWMLNRLTRKVEFTEAFLNAWILHNIEESGETEKFVPQLYAQSRSR